MTAPVAAGLWTDADPPAPLGGRHKSTGRIVYPCPDNEDYERIELPREGTIWSWSVQRFRPKSPPYEGPDDFEPFAFGYVELPGAVVVETHFDGIPFDELKVGKPVVFQPATGANGKLIPAFGAIS
ncbi:MAG: OB-fold domain-containing protein [Pseudomonadota bacterium]